MKLKHCITALLLIVTVNFSPIIALADEPIGDGGMALDDGTGTSDVPIDPDTPVPFDGGVSMLIAAGVAYGLKKKYDHNKQKTEEENNGI